ncbi:MAG: succinylglutamate desuccinylase/aspartoacylase family protein [Xanthomonadales bacterium]|nr:succinylglutamate desuccinylase/aspartoacylase family protein [Xanthomonadales bacterium]
MAKKNTPITIGDIEVMPGERTSISLPVADLYTATSLSMPVEVICGRMAGPVMFVSAVVHGDELNGVEIIQRLLKRKALKRLRGTLLAVPIVNVHGFLNQSRYLPDRRDLNRSFPGSAKGSIAGRLANLFVREVVSKADFGIDLHTGSQNRINFPQIRASLAEAGTEELARAFGAPMILNASIREGSLRAAAAELGLPVLVYEAGEALRFDEISIRAGLRGILNVMRHRQMLPRVSTKSTLTPMIANTTRWVRAPDSGIVIKKASLGSAIRKGQSLAVISDPIGHEEQPVIAPFDGIVIGRTNLPLAHEGDALFNMASFESVPEAADAVEEFAAVHDADPNDVGSHT